MFEKAHFWFVSGIFPPSLHQSWLPTGRTHSWYCFCIKDVCWSCPKFCQNFKKITRSTFWWKFQVGRGHFKVWCLLFGVTCCRNLIKQASKIAANPSISFVSLVQEKNRHNNSLYNPKKLQQRDVVLFFSNFWHDVNAARTVWCNKTFIKTAYRVSLLSVLLQKM